MNRDGCRSCGKIGLVPVLDLGFAPIADRLVASDSPPSDDPHAPLAVASCGSCGLVQLTHTVDPADLFDDHYPYLSSVSDTLKAEAETLAGRLIGELALDGESWVFEIASNDGYLLRHFQRAGIPVLGIDPARPAVEAAMAHRIDTLHGFFDRALGARLAAEGHRADLVIANNVLAHVPDVDGFLEGVALVTKPTGRAVFQVQWLHDLIKGNAFDTIYHQHVFYFSLTALLPLLARHDFTVLEVERIPAQGGSLRLHAGRAGEPGASVGEILEIERRSGLGAAPALEAFAGRVEATAARIRDLVRGFRRNGDVVAAYGAAAKGTTLLHVCSLGAEDISYVVDRNPVKQGQFMPGSRIRIVAPDKLRMDPPTAILLLAWNLADEILGLEAAYIRSGGRFIVPLPEPRFLP